MAAENEQIGKKWLADHTLSLFVSFHGLMLPGIAAKVSHHSWNRTDQIGWHIHRHRSRIRENYCDVVLDRPISAVCVDG